MRPFISSPSIIIKIGILPLFSFNSAFIAFYIVNRLKNRFPVGKVLSFVIKKLCISISKRYIKGFRILLSGRFSRKDRASYI